MLNEYGGLDHLVHGGACGLQDLRQIGQRLSRLVGHVVRVDAAGLGVNRQLAGNEQEISRCYPLRIGANSGRGLFGIDAFCHGFLSFLP